MEQSNTQLPAEVVEQIATQGEIFANKYLNGKVNTHEFGLLEEAWSAGATEYATKLHTLQIEFNNIRQANKRWEESFNIAQRGYDTAYKDLEKLKERCDKMEAALKEIAESNCDQEVINYSRPLHSADCRACKAKLALAWKGKEVESIVGKCIKCGRHYPRESESGMCNKCTTVTQ
jgi:hypothetical protein